MSPGPLKPRTFFKRVAHSGQFLLPHYTSAFILATDVKFFYPGLGSWNYSDYNSESSNVINILMKYAYAQALTGSIGPFSFQFQSGSKHNFRIRRKDGGLMITIPGGQVVGYILTTVPRFPKNQKKPILDPLYCDDHPTGSPRRKKRSISDDPLPEAPVDLKQLAKSLFSEGLHDPLTSTDSISDNKMISTKYIQKIIEEGDLKREKLTQFIESHLKSENHQSTTTPLGESSFKNKSEDIIG